MFRGCHYTTEEERLRCIEYVDFLENYNAEEGGSSEKIEFKTEKEKKNNVENEGSGEKELIINYFLSIIH